MRKAYYIDTFSVGHMHEMYDASSLKMFCSLYDEIDYYARRDSIKNVSEMLGKLPSNVKVHHILLVSHYGRFVRLRSLLKQVLATLWNLYYVIKSPYDTDVIINYNTVIALYPLNWLCKILKKRVLIVCHGEMLELEERNPVSPLFKHSIRFFKRSNIRVAKTLWFAVLGNGIRKNVIPLVTPQIREKLLSFDHSAIFSNVIAKRKSTSSGKLVLGYIGGYRVSKGADIYLQLARNFKDNPNVEFRIIGNIGDKRKLLECAGVTIPDGVGNYFLSREELYSNILDLDYAVYCLPPEGYRFTASGSVFDAIDCNTPIIALHNDYLDNMFETCGEFGYLEDNVEALKGRIAWLLNNKNEISWNWERVRHCLSPECAAKAFSKSKWKEI